MASAKKLTRMNADKGRDAVRKIIRDTFGLPGFIIDELMDQKGCKGERYYMKISSKEIREKFLKYFESKRHLRISGASIIPNNDPTLLFINSGMAPLKKYFTGEEQPPQSDLCNIQPCIRTIDIDEVGDRHHLTSFEMLGSWSINNYFKKDAIGLAFELLVNEFKIPKERLYATVFEGSAKLNLKPDNDSAKIWEETGFAKDHIVFSPFEDNFWGPTSETGPCGPCTEIFYDTGDEFGESYHKTGVFDTKKRYIEIWNAGVFMEFFKNQDGSYGQLKFKSVDTGAGIERLAMTLNGLTCIYDIDLIKPIKDKAAELAQAAGGSLTERELRIITDHVRTSTFIISENILPSNEGRGYIPRRLLRKCIAIIIKNKLENFSFTGIIDKVIGNYGEYYPKFRTNRNEIVKIIENEKANFEEVLRDGFKKFEKICTGRNFVISGKDAFLLVSTYGFPFELIREFAEEKGGRIDEEEYRKEFDQHREISRSSGNRDADTDKLKLSKNGEEYAVDWEKLPLTLFKGYDTDECNSEILALIDYNTKKPIDKADQGEVVIAITRETSLYAESGGQTGDTGLISGSGFELEVLDVQKTEKQVFLHLCKVIKGSVNDGARVNIQADSLKRNMIRANHTSVHLLQSALRRIFNDKVKQAGSLVDAERLRFDFILDRKLSEVEKDAVEQEVNRCIQMNLKVETNVMKMDDAIKSGALAFFEEKYGETVRVVSISGISRELCGGTHARNTGDIGLLKILSEGSIGRGIRRISAVTGNTALKNIQQQLALLKEISVKLKTPNENLIKKIDSFLESPKPKKNQEKKEQLTQEEIRAGMKKNPGGIDYFCRSFDYFDNNLRNEAQRVSEIISGVVCFTGVENDQVKIIIAVHKSITGKVKANSLLQKALVYFDGKGGGYENIASGGGGKPENVAALFGKFGELL